MGKKITVELEEDPGIRFTIASATAEYREHKFRVAADTVCGIYISVDGRRFRLSPEALIDGLGRALGIYPPPDEAEASEG